MAFKFKVWDLACLLVEGGCSTDQVKRAHKVEFRDLEEMLIPPEVRLILSLLGQSKLDEKELKKLVTTIKGMKKDDLEKIKSEVSFHEP